MILTWESIKEEVRKGRIKIDPFKDELLNPNSYNFRIDKKIVVYKYDKYIDLSNIPQIEEIDFPDSGLLIKPNTLYLGCTFEKMGSDFFVPFIEGRSSTGRIGLFVHITAPLGDIGFYGQWTLQLHSTVPVIIYPYQRIGQIMFFKTEGKIKLYNGKYQSSEGPQWTRIYKDFVNNEVIG